VRAATVDRDIDVIHAGVDLGDLVHDGAPTFPTLSAPHSSTRLELTIKLEGLGYTTPPIARNSRARADATRSTAFLFAT
jgi:hypothetical protein